MCDNNEGSIKETQTNTDIYFGFQNVVLYTSE